MSSDTTRRHICFPHKWIKYIKKTNNFINHDLNGFSRINKNKHSGILTASYTSSYHIRDPSNNLINTSMDLYASTTSTDTIVASIDLNITFNVNFYYTKTKKQCNINILFNNKVINIINGKTPKHTYNKFIDYINDYFVDYNLNLFH